MTELTTEYLINKKNNKFHIQNTYYIKKQVSYTQFPRFQMFLQFD